MTDEARIVPPDDQTTLEWITVLCAAGLDYRLAHESGMWVILVPTSDDAAVRAEIAAYEESDRHWPEFRRSEEAALSPGPAAWSPAWVAVFVLACHAWLGPYDAARPLLRAAAADPARILAGETWRVITALMLHADWGHAAGNAGALLLFGHLVAQRVGSGTAWLLILAAGAGGNALAAALIRSGRVSVGASTACFAALGLLTSAGIAAYARRWGSTWIGRRRRVVPLAAGLGLLAMLGAGPGSDPGGHVFGFVAGMAFGPALYGARARAGAWRDRTLLATSLAFVLLAWFVARTHA